MKKSFLILSIACVALSIRADEIKSGEYFVTQSWSQERDFDRPYFVNVPDVADSDPLPVLIFLHGNGGNTERAIKGFMNRYPTVSSRCTLVFAQGYKESWNIVSERAKSDDLGFIEEIVATLTKYENVQKENFTIMGSSNGAALVNQIAIETMLPQIENYVSLVSPLNSYQHDGKNFKAKGEDNNYSKIARPMVGKRILNVSGTDDHLVPYDGGPSKGIPAKGGKLSFVAAEESIFLWAKHFGYEGMKMTDPTETEGELEKFVYMDGDVIHIKVKGEGHGAGGALKEKELLKFLKLSTEDVLPEKDARKKEVSVPDGLSDELGKFLQKNAPATLQAYAELEKNLDTGELEEVRERMVELREAYDEVEEEAGKDWALIEVEELENEALVEFTMWLFEEEKIGGDEAEKKVVTLMRKRLAIRKRANLLEISEMEGEIEQLENEIEEREERADEIIAEWMEELLGEFEREEEWDEEDKEEEVPKGAIYTPAPAKNSDEEKAIAVAYHFEKDIVPALEKYCFDCHDRDSAKGDIDIESALDQKPLVRNLAHWRNVAERVKSEDMPPEDEPQPSAKERLQLRAWLANEVDGFDYSTVRNPGHVPTRRLTREEYNRTIRDLVGLDLRPADEFPMDFSGTSGFSNSANTLFLQTAHLDRYMTAADDVIDAVRNDPGGAWKKLKADREGEIFLNEFLRQAYRRPPTDGESKVVLAQFSKAKEAGETEDEALARALKFILISPKFLLRSEQADDSETGDQPVLDYDLASRLSYFLWASTPDESLLKVAKRGELAELDQRRGEVLRMLDDSRSFALGEIFVGEWLGTNDLGPRIRKDPIDNPWCTESLMAAMRNETSHFVHSLILKNAPVSRLLDADYTFLNGELARFYRIGGVEGEAMQRVSLKIKNRGGLLGQASVLATTSYPDRTSPVVRGAWILQTLLGTPPPPPPPNVDEIEVEGRGRKAALTLRKKLERHRDSKQCSGCHSQIDPLGFALENYAEFGQWRNDVDSRGTLPNGATFQGPAGLKLALIDNRLDDLGSQVIRKMLAYALGRQLEYYDEAVVLEIAAKLKPEGYPLRDIVLEITNSYPFTTRRLPSKNESDSA